MTERQSAYSCVATVRSQRLFRVRELLKDAGFQAHARDALSHAPGVHFARMLALDSARDADGHYLPPALVFSTWHDGPREAHLHALTERTPEWLTAALSHCETGGKDPSNPREMRELLRCQSARPLVEFNSAPGRTVDQLRHESTLVPALRPYLADAPLGDPVRMLDQLRERARAEPSLRWMFQPTAHALPGSAEQLRRWLWWLVRTAPQWMALFASLRQIRREERAVNAAGAACQLAPPPQQVARDSTQNPYTSVTVLKPGPQRQRALRLILDFVNTVGGMRSNLSSLTTIRFAHFIELDAGRRLMFASIYDGSWDAYMSDFISLAGWAMTGIWTNTVGFPPTDYLLLNGARHERAFRSFVREHEVETSFWFRAYPGFSNEHIADAVRIRATMQDPQTREDAASCLSLF